MDPYFLSGQVKDWAFILTLIGLCVWVAYIVTTGLRRRQQATMQKALLEKFVSAHDFAEFLQSPAGQKYVTSLTDQVTSPRNSILGTIRVGLVVLALGAGAHPAAGILRDTGLENWLHAAGTLLICVGVGFLVSALVSFFLAKKISVTEKE